MKNEMHQTFGRNSKILHFFGINSEIYLLLELLWSVDSGFKQNFKNLNETKINGSPVLQSQIKSYPDAVRTCQDQNSSLTVPKNTNSFFDFAISEPKNQFWSPIKRLNMTHYQALFQLVKHYFI